MPRKITIELNYHPAVLASMCNHAWDDVDHPGCPTGDGLGCPFRNAFYCTDITTQDWEAVCLAREEKDEA